MNVGVEVVVRYAVPADATGIARVHTLAWRQGYAGLLPEDFLQRRVVTADDWVRRFADPLPRSAVSVAVRGDELVGFVLTGPAPGEPAPEHTTTGQLFAIYVLADHWGVGIGQRLHASGLASLVAHGFTRAGLEVLTANARTIAFYEHRGWVDANETTELDLGGVVATVSHFDHDLGISTK